MLNKTIQGKTLTMIALILATKADKPSGCIKGTLIGKFLPSCPHHGLSAFLTHNKTSPRASRPLDDDLSTP